MTGGRPPHELGPHWGEVGIHGVHRLREWEAVFAVEAAGVDGDELDLVALSDGRVLPPEAHALAVAIGRPRPFRARAVRRERDLWVVGVRPIVVEERLEPGDELERVEGEVVVRGRRLVGSLWEVERARL
ncbi:MAG TPA: hypothetical protein VNT58_01170 [Gaiellaceae bacterium]|nr:hypothetical protein [Gaiellaceae bacterium]